ncbi:uncharacterized protein J5F26_016745 isoform 2-T2 [Ciconia maguari]
MRIRHSLATMGYSKEPALRSLIRIALYCSACLPHQTFPEVTGSRETSQLSSPSYILKSVFGLRASKFLCSVPELFDTCNYRETGEGFTGLTEEQFHPSS